MEYFNSFEEGIQGLNKIPKGQEVIFGRDLIIKDL